MIWGGVTNPPEGYPVPRVKLLPTVYLENDAGELEAHTDTTPLMRRFDREYEGRKIIPADPVLSFLSDLIEDYGDEWLTKAMFHYRWHFQDDIDNAGPLLVHWHNPQVAPDAGKEMSDFISKRQIERLYVVGSNDVTAETIDASYKRFLNIMDDLLQHQAYVLGNRPCAADFALYGQLTQLVGVDPTPMRIADDFPRIKAWVGRVDDLSGLEVAEENWLAPQMALTRLAPLLQEIGRTYMPAIEANAKAIADGQDTFSTQIDGRPWQQPTFPYQAKCLAALGEAFASLSSGARDELAGPLKKAGCGALLT